MNTRNPDLTIRRKNLRLGTNMRISAPLAQDITLERIKALIRGTPKQISVLRRLLLPTFAVPHVAHFAVVQEDALARAGQVPALRRLARREPRVPSAASPAQGVQQPVADLPAAALLLAAAAAVLLDRGRVCASTPCTERRRAALVRGQRERVVIVVARARPPAQERAEAAEQRRGRQELREEARGDGHAAADDGAVGLGEAEDQLVGDGIGRRRPRRYKGQDGDAVRGYGADPVSKFRC